MRMLVDAQSRKVAIESCYENTKNSVPFSKNPKTQTYSIVLKIPALLAAARKLAEVEEGGDPISFRGTLYPEEKVIIFDLSEPLKASRRYGRRTVSAEDPEETEQLEPEVVESPVEEAHAKRKRGRPRKNA